jgi:hypothetical protein
VMARVRLRISSTLIRPSAERAPADGQVIPLDDRRRLLGEIDPVPVRQ